MNVEFLLASYFIGLFVDWVFQNQWQAVNKSKWGKDDDKFTSLLAVTSHSFVYGSFTAIATGECINLPGTTVLLLFIVLFISHCIIDTRIPVKWIMRLKGMSEEQINDTVNYGFMHIGIDHRLHEMVLFILSFIV